MKYHTLAYIQFGLIVNSHTRIPGNREYYKTKNNSLEEFGNLLFSNTFINYSLNSECNRSRDRFEYNICVYDMNQLRDVYDICKALSVKFGLIEPNNFTIDLLDYNAINIVSTKELCYDNDIMYGTDLKMVE